MNNENIQFKIDGKTVNIKDFNIFDEEVYNFLQETEENKRNETLFASIKLGVTGLKRMNIGSEMDFIEKRFNLMVSRFDRLFDPANPNGYLGKLIYYLKEYLDRGGVMEDLLDPSKDGSPLGKLRREILQHYGGNPPKCAYCHCNIFECLDIDHINNNGFQERKKWKSASIFYRWIITNNFPPNYQILCRNCNWLKYLKNKNIKF